MFTDVATSNDPDARISAGMQKRLKNLASEEFLIEVMKDKGLKLFGEKVFEHSSHQCS
tara:strand:+ start:297 stop:470 length:174 start_codon:yes stop_codon:yes gene_type:complete